MAEENHALSSALRSMESGALDGLAERMRALLEAILGSRLWAADEDGAPGGVEDESGDWFLAVFATKLDLHFFDPGCPALQVSGDDAIRAVASGRFDGMVINPGVRQFELSRDDVLDLFHVDTD